MKQLHIIITGKVQGVFFRHNTNIVAQQLGLTGFVRNLDSGHVEIIAQGNEEQLAKLIEFCRKGPDESEVVDLQVNEQSIEQPLKSFSIRF